MYLLKAWKSITGRARILPKASKRTRRTARRTLHEPLEPRWLMTGTANPLGTISTTTGAAYVGNPIFFSSQTTQIHQAPGADGGNPSAAAIAPDGVVEYGTGVAQLSATPALQSDVGVKFGITLLWSNQVAAALGPTGNPTLGSNRFGYGITAAEIPQLIAAGSITFTDGVGSVSPTLETNGAVDSIVVQDGSRTVTFAYSAGSYTAQGFSLDKLTYDATNDHYFFVDSAGDAIEFHGFNSSVTTLAAERGQFLKILDSAGNQTVAHYDDASTGHLTEVDLYASGDTATKVDQYTFEYDSSVSSDLVSEVELRRSVGGSMTLVGEFDCTYYDASGTGANAYGNSGDLMLAQIEDGAGGISFEGGNVLDTTFLRYDTSTGSGAYQHGLHEIFSNAAFARLMAREGTTSVTTAEAASDADATPYADVRLDYGGPNGAWVTGLTTGLGGVSYAYTINPSPDYTDAYNNWKMETVESAFDGGKITTYTNYDGETLLQDVLVPTTTYGTTGQDLRTAFQLDSSNGRVLQIDRPSAVAGYSDSGNTITVSLMTTGGGVIDLIDYYTSTDYSPTTITTTTTSTSNVGGVAGYVKDHAVENATTSAIAIQDYLQYNNVTAATTIDGFSVSDSLAPIASVTVYTAENSSISGATGAELTSIPSSLIPAAFRSPA
jgi:hypothetical protein